ncbi:MULTISPECIES: STAS domain-containing protein [Streptomyces]|uniref:STAS domain-containing protein n=1 Tax=Streptomyces ehimensis TaxID=68195 RepID=A0ABV9BEN8_9ACTN
MTIEWHYTDHGRLGIMSVSGYLGAHAVPRFGGAIGWAFARGTGPLILDLTALKGWSVEGQRAIADAAARLASHGRALELAAIPADGSVVPHAAQQPVPVHPDLDTALAAHHAVTDQPVRQWRTDTPNRNTISR